MAGSGDLATADSGVGGVTAAGADASPTTTTGGSSAGTGLSRTTTASTGLSPTATTTGSNTTGSSSATEAPAMIDAHIHLWRSSDLPSLVAWPPGPDSHAQLDAMLARRRSLAEYQAATAAPDNLRGFVLVEANRVAESRAAADGGEVDLASRDDVWAGPFDEIAFARRIVEGDPGGADDGFVPGIPLLAMIPWAPLPAGPAVVADYLAAAEQAAGPRLWPRVRGFRFHLQDQPAGTCTAGPFVDALKLLGRRRFVFDVGADNHRVGRRQLTETLDMVTRAHEGVEEEDMVVFVLEHLLKPDLTILNPITDPGYHAWRETMFALARCRRTYLKLSGCFSDMGRRAAQVDTAGAFEHLMPWLSVVLAAFGPRRLMFASDWPVCNVGMDAMKGAPGYDDGEGAWRKWRRVVDRVAYMASLADDDCRRLWAGTAAEAYGIEL